MRELIEKLENLTEEEGSPIDGKDKRPAINHIRKLIGRTNDGFFSDEYWKPISATFKILSKNNIPYQIQNTKYIKDNGVPSSKIWFIEIPFRSKRQTKRGSKIYGTLTAAGAGTVQDPLSRYDVTLVLS